MNKHLQILMSFLMWCVIAGMMGSAAHGIGISPIVAQCAFGVVTFLLVISRRDQITGVYRADGIDVEQWMAYMVERLWQRNQFMQMAWSDDEYVLGGAVVHIPQPGAKGGVVKNNNTFPLSAVRRTDSEVSYVLDKYSTTPMFLPKHELATISYDKAMSLMDDMFGVLMDAVSNDMIYKWLNGMPAANVLRTNGAATASTETGQSGNRLALNYERIKAMRTKMDKANVPKEGRVCLIESNTLGQFTDSLTITQQRNFSEHYNAETGAIGRLELFDFVERSSTCTVAADISGGLLANDFETATAATDNLVTLCYHKNFVARALGDRELFHNEKDALYQGNIDSSYIRAGGRRRYADSTGVYAIVQDAA